MSSATRKVILAWSCRADPTQSALPLLEHSIGKFQVSRWSSFASFLDVIFLHDAVAGETSVAFVVSMKSLNAASTFAKWAALEAAYPFLWPVGSELKSPPIIVALDSPFSFIMPLLSVCWTYSWRSRCPEVAW